MTANRERTRIITGEAGQAEFSTDDAQGEGRSPRLLVAEVASSERGASKDQLCVIVESVEHSPRAASVGAGVVKAIRDIYTASAARDPLTALTTAIDAANLALYQQNLSTTPGHRVLLGLTCLLVRAEEVLICQVPPTQLILSQGGVPITLPDLATWASDYQPHARDDRQGLGATEATAPLFFRATLEDGDLITLCTSNIARLLPEGSALGPLLADDPVAAVEFLVDLSEQHGLATAYATSIAPTITEGAGYPTSHHGSESDDNEPTTLADDGEATEDEGWFGRNLREMRERSRIIPWPRFGERHTRPQSARAEAVSDDGSTLRDALESGTDDERTISAMSIPTGHLRPEFETRAEGDEGDEGWEEDYVEAPQRHHQRVVAQTANSAPRGVRGTEHGPLDDILPSRRRAHRANPFGALGSLVALPLLGIGTIVERVLPSGGRRRDDRHLDDGRKRVWPLGGLERYRAGGLPFGRALPLILLVGLLVFVAVLLVSLRNHQARVEQARFDGALAQVAQAREAASALPDRQAAHVQLLALPEQLKNIPAADKPGRQERIAAEAAAINAARDQVGGIQRLAPDAVNVLGALPPGALAVNARPQIVVGGGKQYVFANGTVYLADGRGTLTKILVKGDLIGGTAAGALLGIAWRETNLFAYSETQGFVRDNAGAWTMSPLAANGRKATAVESFVGNLYILEAERGQIIKWAAGAFNQSPQPWSSSKTNADLNLAVDFTIDADIYALLSDGRVLDLYQGEVKATLSPAVVPPLAGATAIASTLEGKWLYLLDAREGRIVRMGRDGTQITVYKPAPDAKTFTNAREIAVDEKANTAYLLTDDGLVSVRLP